LASDVQSTPQEKSLEVSFGRCTGSTPVHQAEFGRDQVASSIAYQPMSRGAGSSPSGIAVMGSPGGSVAPQFGGDDGLSDHDVNRVPAGVDGFGYDGFWLPVD